MAERQLHGLQRVLGVNALSSTAYGNVGSSIDYALGLVAALAAGLVAALAASLMPLVFGITGALFYCTATTYAEATAMYLGWFQSGVEFYVAMLAVTILIAATSAGVLGVSRMTYSMGMYRQLPDTMRRLHRRYRTPYVGILVFSGFACLALLPGQADFLGTIYAFGAMLSFSMAHLSLIWLRISDPEARRPYRSPGRLRVRGHELPPLYRRRQGLDFVSKHQVAVPQAVTETEAEIAARAVVEHARLQGGRRVSGQVERVRPGGSGRLIVDEARSMRAHALVLPLPPRTGTTLFGKTVETVLADRPCRVIIESEPASA